MTDTPRTDVIITKDNFVPGDVIDLCYDLESKLAEATREIERLRAERDELLESIRPIVEEVTLANECNAVGGLVCIGFPEARIIHALAKSGEPK